MSVWLLGDESISELIPVYVKLAAYSIFHMAIWIAAATSAEGECRTWPGADLADLIGCQGLDAWRQCQDRRRSDNVGSPRLNKIVA